MFFSFRFLVLGLWFQGSRHMFWFSFGPAVILHTLPHPHGPRYHALLRVAGHAEVDDDMVKSCTKELAASLNNLSLLVLVEVPTYNWN